MGVAAMLCATVLLAAADGADKPPPGPIPGSADAVSVALAPELSGATLIDSTVALLDQRVITLSQLDQEARLAFVEHGAMAGASDPLDSAKRSAALSYLINQILLEEEAARLQVFEISDQEVNDQERALEARFPSPAAFKAFLARFDIAPDILDQSVRRRLRAERYLADRLRLVAGSGAESQKQVASRAEALLQEIRARHEVRLLTNFGPEAAASVGHASLPLRREADGGHAAAWGEVR